MSRHVTLPPQPFRALTVQQEAVARCVAQGKSYKSIARVLGWSEFTAQHYVRAIADMIPSDPEADELTPYQKVLVWAYWRYRAKPERGAA